MSFSKKARVFIGQLFKQLQKSSMFDGAAALSFYFILSMFPALMVALSLLSFFSLSSLEQQLQLLVSSQAPEDIQRILFRALKEVKNSGSQAGFISVAVLVGFWTVSSGVAAALRQIDGIYKNRKDRNLFSARLESLLLTLLLSVASFITLLLLVLGSTLQKLLVLNDFQIFDHNIFDIATYLTVGLLFLFCYISLYYFGSRYRIKSLFPGALVATIAFLFVSRLFGFYVKNIANYSAIYGSITAVIVLLFWFYIIGFLLLLGAEVNMALKKSLSQR